MKKTRKSKKPSILPAFVAIGCLVVALYYAFMFNLKSREEAVKERKQSCADAKSYLSGTPQPLDEYDLELLELVKRGCPND